MTAEFVLLFPAVLVLIVVFLGIFATGIQSLRVSDAALQAARELARSEPEEMVSAHLQRLLSRGIFSERMEEEYVCARVSAPVGSGLAEIFLRDVSAEVCMVRES